MTKDSIHIRRYNHTRGLTQALGGTVILLSLMPASSYGSPSVTTPNSTVTSIQQTNQTKNNYRHAWNAGNIEIGSQLGLKTGADPLRLLATPKSAKGKPAVKVQQQFRNARLTGLAFTSGENEIQGAGRLEGKLTSRLQYGVSYMGRTSTSSKGTSKKNNAFGVDVNYQLTSKQRISVQKTATKKGGADAKMGSGSRIYWEYAGKKGMKARLGHLDLSETYDAAVSATGTKLKNNVSGTEASLHVPFAASGLGITKGSVYVDTHSYRRSDSTPVKGINVQTELSFRDRVSLKSRFDRHEEKGARSTKLRLNAEHKRNKAWKDSVLFTQTASADEVTRELRLETRKGGATRFNNYGVELASRKGKSGKSQSKVALSASARNGNIVYESRLQYLEKQNDRGVNAFARAAYEDRSRKGIVSSAYISVGDKTAPKVVAKFEIGMEIRF